MVMKMKIYRFVCESIIILIICSAAAYAQKADWQRQDVDWRLNNGSKIKAVYYPPQLKDKLFKKDKFTTVRKEKISSDSVLAKNQLLAGKDFSANIVEAPPINGFVPYLTVSVTDERKAEGELEAVPDSTIGSFLTANPQKDFGVGIFDTGAASHVISYDIAEHTGINNADILTGNMVDIAGVTGSASVFVSQPLGLFFGGLAAVNPSNKEINTSGLLGEWNISISVAPSSEPNVPTAIGTPFSVYYTAVIDNSNVITMDINGIEYSGPSVQFYENYDPGIPQYQQIIPLELRPLGAVNVQYIPGLDSQLNLVPQSPSTIIGNLAQSVFFVHSVDIYEKANSALDKNRFMLDTGAQVSVIGSRIASRLHLNPNFPEFLVEVSGINGETIDVPGFTIDRLVIPTLGDWFIATNVPVILLDVFSPEGGTLDGIVGMNLFNQFNIVLRGGGLFLQEDPTLELQPLNWIAGDIAPESGDGIVDYLDLQAFVLAWLSEGTMPPSLNWNPDADIAPANAPDNIINFLDLSILAQHWFEHINP
jgi:predicted aspartyl protease